MRRIRQGDMVRVISGADRGKTGKVLRLVEGGSRVLVEGVNLSWRHMKPTQKQPRGGRVRKESPLHASNVMPLDPESGAPTRIGAGEENGKKVRIARKSGKPVPAPAGE